MADVTRRDDNQVLARMRLIEVLRCRRDMWVKSKIGVLRNGNNLTQTKTN